MEQFLDSFQQWGVRWAPLFPLFGSILIAVITIGVAILVTRRINQTTKRTEFFLGFTTRFHDICARH